ncbi:hypothetical protein Clacol_008212 [Clathrus columnatus]|uniref:RNA polymerase II degradation factor 1 n=1 Tax=Clathrus columnatus TaxID=1419009 RepID=A0AAV5AM68_9AGAM|nr:hypothetical protein Clacol_008212 [Clathrus columnatus]
MSSSYKPNAPHHTAESTTELSLNHKLQEKVSKLQELFSTWSSDDIQSVLAETAGDVELAAARISEGYAEQWGSVARKKDKKPQRSHQSTVSYSSRPDRDRQNNESRGSNRGRGRGRGGGRGASRAPPQSVHPHSKDYLANGTSVPLSITAISSLTSESVSNTAAPTAPTLSADKSITGGAGADMSVSLIPFVHDNAHAKVLHPIPIGPTVAEQEVTITELASISKSQLSAPKAPPTSKRSWAQIAKPQEKLKSSISSSLVGSQHPPSATAPAVPPAVSEQPLTPSQPIEVTTWEEPTTVPVLPTWEEESPSTLPQPSQLSLSENSITMTITTATTSDGWISTDTATSPLPPQDIWEAKPSMPPLPPSSPTHEPTWVQGQSTEEVSNTSVTTDASITPTSIAPATSITSVPVSTVSVPSKPSTPSVAHARPLSVHRSNAKFSKDQAVVISAFAGNIAPHTEKLGMQFGSLNLNGDDTFDGSITLDSETTIVLPPDAPKQDPVQSQQAQAAVQTQPQEPVQPPTHVQANQPVFTQSTSHQQPPTSVVSMQAQQATQTSQPPVPVTSFSSHPALTHQQPQHHHQSQHTYGHQQQSIHFDGPQPQGPHGSGSQNNSYFRPEPPFYHTPTPPQNAPPDHQSGYPAAFSPVGMGAGIHGHSQNLGGQNVTHLSGFGGIPGAEYNYSEGQRGFYDYVPSGFGSRVGHDEPGKGNLSLAQSNQPSSVLTSNTSQAQNTNGPQTSSTQPPTSQQNQQGYPPMQYFYPPYFQNTYHPPYPNASYSQPYVPKFPVYTQGPVGPGSAPPSGKSLGGPYNPPGSQSHLYHGQGGFDDPGSSYPHHQSSTNLGAADFQKQTPHHHHQQPQQHYGGQPNQGLQSFLSMQQSAGAAQSVGPTAQSRSGASPESTYKPYGGTVGATDKPVGIVQSGQQGRGATVQQGQQQGGSFYPGGRFGGSASTGPQHQGQQQAYAQGAEQGQFYSYQPRQQHQGVYWQ